MEEGIAISITEELREKHLIKFMVKQISYEELALPKLSLSSPILVIRVCKNFKTSVRNSSIEL